MDLYKQKFHEILSDKCNQLCMDICMDIWHTLMTSSNELKSFLTLSRRMRYKVTHICHKIRAG